MLHDAHNHLHDPALAPRIDTIAAELRAAGLARAVANGTCETDWPDVAAFARRHDFVLPSFGLHPWDCGNRTPLWLDTLRATLDAHPGAPIGEIGLDRWMLDDARPDDPRLAGLRRAPLDEQTEVLRAQLALAAARNLAASIHCNAAHGALLDVLETTPLPARGFLLHGYNGPAGALPRLVALGAYFSFNAKFLAPAHQRPRDTFCRVPRERLLVETDAPATPPGSIAAAYAGLAQLRGEPPETLAAAVAENFARLFAQFQPAIELA